MSFSLAPSKKVLKARDQLAQLVPEYRDALFTSAPRLPESLLTLRSDNKLLHLHTNYTEADCILQRKERSPVHVQNIAVPEPRPGSSWLTILEVDPKAFVYALLSTTGTVLFIELRVRITGEGNAHQAFALLSKKCATLCEAQQFTKGISICLNGFRFLLLQSTSDGVQRWNVLQCDIESYELWEPKDVTLIVQDILRDYGTENNVLGCRMDVVYYKKEAIATVPPTFRVLSVFGTQCATFQMLVQNRTGGLEWWRWTGTECEAVVLPQPTGVPVGNLLWF
jgi:hypothetical protein